MCSKAESRVIELFYMYVIDNVLTACVLEEVESDTIAVDNVLSACVLRQTESDNIAVDNVLSACVIR